MSDLPSRWSLRYVSYVRSGTTRLENIDEHGGKTVQERWIEADVSYAAAVVLCYVMLWGFFLFGTLTAAKVVCVVYMLFGVPHQRVSTVKGDV